MATINIHLPESLRAFVEDEVSRRGYRDASAFVQSLLEAERQRQVGREIEQMLLETANGPLQDWTD